MDKFIVSAWKYRPVTFDTVVGQPSITNTLKMRFGIIISRKLFFYRSRVWKNDYGPDSAKTINCENVSSNVEACNECASCDFL